MKPILSVLSLALLLLWCGFPPLAIAQSPLERLDRQIRDRGRPAAPPSIGTPKPPPPDLSDRLQAEPAYLGVSVTDRDDRGRGVRVVNVVPDSPADKVGIRPNDLLVGIGGIRVRQEVDLIETVKAFSPGDRVDVDLLRQGVPPIRVTVSLADYRPAAASPPVKPDPLLPSPGQIAPRVLQEGLQPGPAVAPAVPRVAQVRPVPRPAIEVLERRIEQLERRIAELERRLAARSANEPTP